jgi:hypothetical protein
VRSAHPEDLGRAYLDRARQHAGGDAPIFVDKFPLNFLYAATSRAPAQRPHRLPATPSARCGVEQLRTSSPPPALLRLVV